jgi:hypothetical protein
MLDTITGKHFLNYPNYLAKQGHSDSQGDLETLFSYIEKEVPMNFYSYEHLFIPMELLDKYEKLMINSN